MIMTRMIKYDKNYKDPRCVLFDACRSYLVLAPKTVRPGADLTVSVSIFRASRNVNVRGELKDHNNALLVSNSTTVASGDEHFLHCQILALC